MSDRSTIFALSSGRPPAAIAVVRISGPRAGVALERLTGRLPSPRQAALARVRDPANGEIIDEALVLWFPAPRSETGEDMAELQLHGGRAIIAAVLAALGKLEGFRPADAGEFTRRAFENGRLDLTAVEGLADLIGAETETQRRQAFRQLKGMLGGQAEAWRTRLIEALALVEAGIDFSDEADVPQDLLRPALDIARLLHEEICAVLAQAGRGERLREGLVVAIAGPPNAGKSTLLNRIARREAAIVSPYAGTTRDVIEVHLDLDGYPVTLLDTAGVRESDDPVEQEGVRRARERAAAADLVLWVVEADGPMGDGQAGSQPVTDQPRHGLKPGWSPEADMPGPLADLMRTTPVWLIRNKTDLLPGHGLDQPLAEEEPFSRTSGSKGAGIQFSRDRPAADLASAPSGSPICSSSAVEARGAFPSAVAVRSAALGPAAPASVPGPVASPPAPPAGASITSAAAFAAGPAFFPVAPAPTSFSGAPLPAGAVLNTRNEYEINNEFKFIYNLSAQQGIGLKELLEALKEYARAYFGPESGLITRERHRHALQEAQAALARALAEGPHREEILAEELRLASRALGRLTGKVDVEDILDVIFRDFCIGK